MKKKNLRPSVLKEMEDRESEIALRKATLKDIQNLFKIKERQRSTKVMISKEKLHKVLQSKQKS